MNQLTCEETDFGQAASKWCLDSIQKHHAQSIYIPAGNTPIALYKIWQNEQPAYLRNKTLVQIDDVLTGRSKGLFKTFFEEHLPSHTNQIEFIHAAGHQADLAILGLGLNGHVAFHEPGVPEHFYSGCVKLTEITRKNLDLEDPTWGITYGAEAFLRTKAILMMVSGKSKREVVKRLLNRDATLPATRLLSHPNFTLLCDRAAIS